MKKKILLGLFALALLATAGFGVQKSLKSDAGLSDLALSNVEALAFGEEPGDIPPGTKYYKYTFGCIDLGTGNPNGKTGVSCTKGGWSECTPVSCN